MKTKSIILGLAISLGITTTAFGQVPTNGRGKNVVHKKKPVENIKRENDKLRKENDRLRSAERARKWKKEADRKRWVH